MEIITSAFTDDEVMGIFKAHTGFIDGTMEGTFQYPCVQCLGEGTMIKQYATSLMNIEKVECYECEGKGFITEPCTITLPDGVKYDTDD